MSSLLRLIVIVGASSLLLAGLPGQAETPAQEKKERGDFLYYHGDINGAIVAFEDAVILNPNFWQAHLSLVNLYLKDSDMDSAISSAREVVRLRPKYADGHMILGNLLRAQQLHEPAIKELNQALSCGADPQACNTAIGLTYLQKGDLLSAKQHLENSSSPEALLGLGLVLIREEKKSEALEKVEMAIRAKSGPYPSAHNLKADLLLSMGNESAAVAEYELAVSQKINVDKPFFALGNIYFKQGHNRQAETMFRRAIQLNPSQAGSHYGLAVTLQEQEKFPEAVREFTVGADMDHNQLLAAKMRYHALLLKKSAPATLTLPLKS